MNCHEFVNAQDIRIIHRCSIFRHSTPYYSIEFLPGSYLVELYGASGGFTRYVRQNDPGKGGYTKGVLKLHSPKTMYLYIGSQGGNTSTESNHPYGGEAGYNGGASGSDDKSKNKDCPSAGGGGATDLRLNQGSWDSNDGLKSRIMVAGGGGSGGCFTTGGNGGNGGGINGEDGYPNENKDEGGKGGGQTGGNFGKGISGEPGSDPARGEAGGSGGGGYYGGYGGKTSSNEASGTGGGGGSSFISGMKGCLAVDKDPNSPDNSIHSSGIYFMFPNTASGINLGDGYAIITKYGTETCLQRKSCSSLSILLFICIFKH